MLSILIPIYNEDVTALVQALAQEGRDLLEFEILCFDDGSTPSFLSANNSLTAIPEVDYQEMPKNLGRSKIRNVLADAAEGDYLLFMDCDSKVVRKNYLSTYIEALDENTLLYGGRCYDTTRPENPEHLLHWKYGSQREQQPVGSRREHPYHSFMTNNFLIPAKQFHKIRFDESLTQYGHEDTLFGMELKKRNIPIIHLDNPLEHTGLETGQVFLDKTRKAIENLHQLNLDGKKVETKLTSAFQILDKMWLSRIFLKSFEMIEHILYDNLVKGRISMPIFDLYKLGILTRMNKK